MKQLIQIFVMGMRPLLIIYLIGVYFPVTSLVGSVFDQSHGELDRLLNKHVSEGAVDYEAIRKDPTGLDRYLDQLAAVSETEFSTWARNEQLAYLINLYNAATIRLVCRHYPLESIKEIGGLFSGPWDQKVVKLFGRTVDLDHFEHDELRKRYQEPRIHFALVCAAKGCPPLAGEPYVAERLDEQLERQARKFMGQIGKNRVVPQERRIILSPIFKWYGRDFGKSDKELIEQLRPYLPGLPEDPADWSIDFSTYDWRLNKK